MPSSSMFVRPQRDSSDAGRTRSPSSFIDGLSPHPSVNASSFLSSSPPPLISGLERHPDAPKPFMFIASDEPSSSDEYDYYLNDDVPVEEEDNVPSTFSRKSRFSTGLSRSRSGGSAPSRSPADTRSIVSTPNLSPSASILSDTSSMNFSRLPFGEDEQLADAESPFDDPMEALEAGLGGGIREVEPYVESEASESRLSCFEAILPSPSAISNEAFSGMSRGCQNYRSFSNPMFRSPSPSAISELLAHYLRRSIHA